MEKSIKRKLDVSGYGRHDTKYFIIFGQHFIDKVLSRTSRNQEVTKNNQCHFD